MTTQPYFETDDLQALLHHLQVKHTMLIGSSHGGAIAMNFTPEHPALVEHRERHPQFAARGPGRTPDT